MEYGEICVVVIRCKREDVFFVFLLLLLLLLDKMTEITLLAKLGIQFPAVSLVQREQVRIN